MTAFEYIYIINEFEVKFSNQYTILFSMVSAFLAAAYFMASSLSMRMLAIVIALYTIAFTFMMLGIFSTGGDMAYLVKSALEADVAGRIELPRTTLISNAAQETYRGMAYGSLVLNLIIYATSLVFMFGVRRSGRQQAGDS